MLISISILPSFLDMMPSSPRLYQVYLSRFKRYHVNGT